MKKAFVFIFVSIVFASGCAGLGGRIGPLSFEDPFTRLGIVHVQPSPEEQAGVTLRLSVPEGNILRIREETKIYAQVRDGRGKLIDLKDQRVETYRKGSRNDSYLLLAESSFEGHSGKIIEETEISTRGEILKLVQGKHDSREGKFTIMNWTRTPLFPEHPVKTGDAWNYEESMSLRLDSSFVKQIDESPYKVQAKSTLTGFAEIKGRRCAVVETTTDQIQTQRLKVLFKNLTLYIRSKVQETCYLDYRTGTVVAKVMKTQTYTNSADSKINDYSIGQSISQLTGLP